MKHIGLAIFAASAFVFAGFAALEELASKNVTEFALIMQPLKLQGATGSTVAPIALR